VVSSPIFTRTGVWWLSRN